MAPGVDLWSTISSESVPESSRVPAITEPEREALYKILESCAKVHSAEEAPGGGMLVEALDWRIRAVSMAEAEGQGDDQPGDDQPGRDSATKNANDTHNAFLRDVRKKLGEMLPANQDLTDVCRTRGIPLETLAINPNNPVVRAKPPQVIGMSRDESVLPGLRTIVTTNRRAQYDNYTEAPLPPPPSARKGATV